VELNGEAITSSRDLRNSVGLMRRGEEAELRLYRNGEAMTLTATIGGPSGQVAITDEGLPALSGEFRGARLRSLAAQEIDFAEQGVLVLEVSPRSPAAAAGIQAGDVIVAVNRRAITDLGEFNAAVEGSERLTALTVLREGRQLLLFVP
jgi:S1-C subfamily serine protease